MEKWSYDGPIMAYGKVICMHWTGFTVAPSEKKARSNLMYQYKTEHGLMPNYKIVLPRDLTPAI